MTSLSDTVIESLQRIVGAEFVSTQGEDLGRLSRTTLPQGTTPAAWVRPATREQIQEILKIATTHRLSIYTISTGKNWGYGDACAPIEGCLLLDLSRMNRILEVNSELAYAVIEPGVTQGQLSRYLQRNHPSLLLDCTGAGPDASIIGNTMERGFGHSAYGDRFAHSCNVEGVLANGQVLTSGFGAYPNASAQHVYKWGIGPAVDGLLTQSNFAIVTRMTVWLMPKTEGFTTFFLTLSTPEAIGPLVDALRCLRLSGTLRSTMHLFNDRRLLASATQFPWGEADGRDALEKAHPDLLKSLYTRFGVTPWAASGSLRGTASETAAAKKVIQQELRRVKGIEKLVFLNERMFGWSQTLRCCLPPLPFLQPIRKLLDKARLSHDLLAGLPSSEALFGGHWRSRTKTVPSGQDPLDTASGLLWVSPVIPMTAPAVYTLQAIAEPIFHEFGFEYQVTLSCINDRALCAVTSICFDRASETETRRAQTCEEKLLRTFLTRGYVPYRASPAQQILIRSFAPDHWSTLEAIKRAWDPEGLLSPGRYLSPQKS